MPKITIGITGLPEILGRDQGIEERYWEPSVSDQWRRLCDFRQLFLFKIFVYSTLSLNISLFHFRFILLLNTASTRLVLTRGRHSLQSLVPRAFSVSNMEREDPRDVDPKEVVALPSYERSAR